MRMMEEANHFINQNIVDAEIDTHGRIVALILGNGYCVEITEQGYGKALKVERVQKEKKDG